MRTELREANEVLHEQLSDTSKRLRTTESEIEKLNGKVDAAREELAKFRPFGRPKGHAGQDLLEERWHCYSKEARRKALLRHSHDIYMLLMNAGVADWQPSAFVLALKKVGMYERADDADEGDRRDTPRTCTRSQQGACC